MAISGSKTLALTLFQLLSILAFTTAQSQDLVIPNVHDILAHYGLPRGLIPDAARDYNLTNGNLEVELTTDVCVVHRPDGGVIIYSKRISGVISHGRIADVRGIHLLIRSPVLETVRDVANGVIKFLLGLPRFGWVSLPEEEFVEIPKCYTVVTDEVSGGEDNRSVAVGDQVYEQ